MVSSQSYPAQLLVDACYLLARRHPLLRMRVTRDQSQKLVVEPIPEFNVNFAVDESASLEGAIGTEVATPLGDERGPLWRVTFLPNVNLGITIHSEASLPTHRALHNISRYCRQKCHWSHLSGPFDLPGAAVHFRLGVGGDESPHAPIYARVC